MCIMLPNTDQHYARWGFPKTSRRDPPLCDFARIANYLHSNTNRHCTLHAPDDWKTRENIHRSLLEVESTLEVSWDVLSNHQTYEGYNDLICVWNWDYWWMWKGNSVVRRQDCCLGKTDQGRESSLKCTEWSKHVHQFNSHKLYGFKVTCLFTKAVWGICQRREIYMNTIKRTISDQTC